MKNYIFRRVRSALENLHITVEPFETEMEREIHEELASEGSGEPLWMITRRMMSCGTPYRVIAAGEGRVISVKELTDILRTVQVDWPQFESEIAKIA